MSIKDPGHRSHVGRKGPRKVFAIDGDGDDQDCVGMMDEDP